MKKKLKYKEKVAKKAASKNLRKIVFPIFVARFAWWTSIYFAFILFAML